jgi:hypothetical protein
MHKPLSRHLAKHAEVHVAEPGVPMPCVLPGDRIQTDWAHNVDVMHIQFAWATMDFGHQAHVFITNAHQTTLNMYHISHLIQLSTANNIGSEARNIVDVIESTVFSSLAGKEYAPTAFDLNHGTIAEPDSAGHASVMIVERILGPYHVVRCTNIEDPPT